MFENKSSLELSYMLLDLEVYLESIIESDYIEDINKTIKEIEAIEEELNNR